MTREEQDQALAAMGFHERELPSTGWRRPAVGAWDLYIRPERGRYLAWGHHAQRPSILDTFDDPISAAAYLLIQVADQP